MCGGGRGKLRKGRKVKVPKPPELVEDRTQRHTGTAKGNRNSSPRGKGMMVTAKIWVSPRTLVSLMRERQEEEAGREGWLVQGSKHRS